ncbi:DUF4421 family protein [Rapidithrix thailandica]|uniref:DUF4421 family protein n=1 Tax=Rapidithrix thailandica TaxID=413964 RepID=A0AAW9S282_9BACT
MSSMILPKYAYIFSFLLLVSMPGMGQAKVDSAYIGAFEQRFALRGYLARNFLFLSDEAQDRIFMPNNPVSIGLGFSKHNTVLNFSAGYGFDFMRNKQKGKTKYLDLQMHQYGRKFVVDMFIQRYQGFYTESNEQKNTRLEIFPDLSIRQYGIFGQYIFNWKRFSYKAAFNQSEKQLKPAGSILLGAGVYFNKIQSDSTLITPEHPHLLQNFQLGISSGYAYTWLIKKRYFISGSLSLGIQFGGEDISQFTKQSLEVSPTVFPRMSVGYNHETWSLRASFVNNMIYSSFAKEASLVLNSGHFQFNFIKRFHEFPLFSKSSQ